MGAAEVTVMGEGKELIAWTESQQAVRMEAKLNPYWWATAYRIMPDGRPYEILDPTRTYYQPYLYEPYKVLGELPTGGRVVVMKSAQTGWTETALNATFWFMDTKGEGVLYMLPTDGILGDFAQARINKAIKLSPELRRAFTDVDNVHIKVGYGQALYLRGAVSKQKLREIPVGMVVRDEYGSMDFEGAEQALSRLGASQYKYVYDLGNPQFPETGIHLAYLNGTQEVWKITCPKCGTVEEPRWPDSVKDGKLVCPSCGAALDKHEGAWFTENPGAPYRSFRMSQLISPTVEPWELEQKWKEAQGDATKLQVFWNFYMGLPYAPEGSRIDDEILSALPRLGEMVLGSSRPTVMGVDVGAVNHVTIRRVEGGVIWAGECDWIEMARKMVDYNVEACGIDAMPETTKAKEFARQFPGKVTLVRYTGGPMSTGTKSSTEDGVPFLTVARTEAIDSAFARILNGEEAMPSNPPSDYFAHFKAMTRQIVREKGREYATWIESGPDHYAHSFVYSELVRDSRDPFEKMQFWG